MRSEQRDAYRTTLTTTVRERHAREDGDWLRLSDTIVYPTSGGQEHDLATLSWQGGEAQVVEALPHGKDQVLHRVQGPLPADGATVHVAIDWPRRYRHMQRHSAQHLLSQALTRCGPGYPTRAVALRSADVTIDVAGEPSDDELADAFAQARAWAYAALPVTAFEVDEAELDAYPLRRPAKVSGTVRLVRMGPADDPVELSACGGTHVRSTAELLPLLFLARQRIRGGLTRITLRAGHEAHEHAQATVAALHDAAQRFSARWDQVAARIDALQEEMRDLRQQRDRARLAWAEAVVRAEIAERRDRAREDPAVLRFAADFETDLAPLAEAAARLAPAAVCVAGAADSAAGKATLLLQAGPAAGPRIDVRPALQAGLAELEGRGGGKPDRAQGAGPRSERLDAALDAAVAALRP